MNVKVLQKLLSVIRIIGDPSPIQVLTHETALLAVKTIEIKVYEEVLTSVAQLELKQPNLQQVPLNLSLVE